MFLPMPLTTQFLLNLLARYQIKRAEGTQAGVPSRDTTDPDAEVTAPVPEATE